MRCPSCGFENPTGMKFCGQCATPLTGPCPACGFANPPGFAFCGQCATPLTEGPTASRPQAPLRYTPSHLAERILTSKAALEGERKQVTVLFADLKGSMELLADRDPEEARAILDPVLERMMAAVHRYEGTVNQVMGDGIMALFGAPLAHEDHAVRACYAALAMQASVKQYAGAVPRTTGVPIHMRGGGPCRPDRRHRPLPRHGDDLLAAPGRSGAGAGGGPVMDFFEILDQVIDLLRRRGRVTYRALQLQFRLDDTSLAVLKEELIKAQRVAVDENHEVLVWVGGVGSSLAPALHPAEPEQRPGTADHPAAHVASPSAESRPPDAERRQLTVLFCDLVDSTVLASQLDPEEWREVVRAYQSTCAAVIQRYDGHVAQYLGDGLLVYFGYPQAHEDDAQRAVRAGLGMVEAIRQLNMRLARERGVSLAVRLGIHTGQVVVGELGGGAKQEQLALGETPNLAARLQGIAAPNTLVISAATSQLLGGFFACQSLGTQLPKGSAQPIEVYHVQYESTARSRLEAAGRTGLTPLVGREAEVGLLRERWAQVKEGLGQVVLLSGEAGIGTSRLVQVLTEQVATEPQAWLTPCQCSPYYQNTALYPMIDLLERVALRFEREESSQQKLNKLEVFLVQYGLPLAETVPLFAALLSVPLAEGYTPLTVSPEQQKQKTLHALLTILLRIAAQQPVLFVMEDLHWVDPSTLELLGLLVDQGPTARLLALLTFRPDFSPPWTGRAHLT
jgi:class 3 adenylate cyclase